MRNVPTEPYDRQDRRAHLVYGETDEAEPPRGPPANHRAATEMPRRERATRPRVFRTRAGGVYCHSSERNRHHFVRRLAYTLELGVILMRGHRIAVVPSRAF